MTLYNCNVSCFEARFCRIQSVAVAEHRLGWFMSSHSTSSPARRSECTGKLRKCARFTCCDRVLKKVRSKLCRKTPDRPSTTKKEPEPTSSNRCEARISTASNQTNKKHSSKRAMSPMQRFGDPTLSKRHSHKVFNGPWSGSMSESLRAENFITTVEVKKSPINLNDSSRQLNLLWQEDPGSRSSLFSSLLLIENSVH